MKPFTESDRYDYPDLTPESIVVDAGCYEGNFSSIIHDKYGCRIIALEPVPEFFEQCYKRLRKRSNVRVLNYALGDHLGTTYLKVKGDQSGEWCGSESRAECGTLTPHSLLALAEEMGAATVCLLKINIEGGEYPVLEYILDHGLAPRFTHLQVQFHTVVPDFQSRHDSIRKRLAATHDMTYDEPFIWTGWTLRR